MVTVCTVLPPPERPRIDAAGDGCFDTLHAESLREVLYVARRRRVDAVIISVHRCHGEARLPARRLPLAHALTRGVAGVPRRFPLSDPRSLGFGRGVPIGLLLAAEFRPASPRGSWGHRRRFSPPLSV